MRITVKMTADELMDVIGAIGDEAVEQDIYVDPLYGNDNMEQILKVVDAALSAMGIEIEEEEEEPEDFDEDNFDFDFDDEEDDEEDDDDNVVYSLTAKGEFALRYMEAGHSFEEACRIADILFGDGE